MTREELNQEKQEEIFKEENAIKRRIFFIKFFKGLFILFIFVAIFVFYTSYFSTTGIIVKEERIINSKIPDSFNGIKIIQFSDLHYGSTMGYQDLKKVVKMINDREVDIVLFTGDLIDANYKLDSKEQERVINLLKKIDAKLGKYAISGEEDGENFNVIFNQSDFSILNNNYELIYNSDNNPILLVGIDSYLNKNYDYNKSYAYFDEATHNSNIYTISMMHEADMVDDIKDTYHSDLYLGGHSHNGNIRIPYIGSLVNEEGSKIYNQAFYNIEGNPLYISSGLGTTGNGIRLFCRPSINFFRISNK